MPGGFTFKQAIDIANKRSEKRGVTLDLNSEAISALVEVCTYSRWWWRRKTMSMVLKSGESRFDLSDAVNFTGEDSADDFQTMVKQGFRVYQSETAGSNRICVSKPTPVFNFEEQSDILALQDGWPAGPPTRYFIQGEPGTLFTDLILDADRPASISYWAVPNLRPDELPDEIPLLPHYFHPILIKNIEKHIYAFGLGESSDKYKAASVELQALYDRASNSMSFADGEVRSMASQICGDAVQST